MPNRKVKNVGPKPADTRGWFLHKLDALPHRGLSRKSRRVRPAKPHDTRCKLARMTDIPTENWTRETLKQDYDEFIEKPKAVYQSIKTRVNEATGRIFSHAGPATHLPTEEEMHATADSVRSFDEAPYGVAAAMGSTFATAIAPALGPSLGAFCDAQRGPSGRAVTNTATDAATDAVTDAVTDAAQPEPTMTPAEAAEYLNNRASMYSMTAAVGERVRSLQIETEDGNEVEVSVVQSRGHKSIQVPGYEDGTAYTPHQHGRVPNLATSVEGLSSAYKVNWQMTGLTELLNNSLVDITRAMAFDPEGSQRVQTSGGVFVPLATVKAGLLEFQEYYAEFLEHGGLNGSKVMGGEAFLLAMVGRRSDIGSGTLKLVEFNECEK